MSLVVCACAETLPDDVTDYREDCTKMNAEPLPKRADDPHEGVKDVYACNVPEADLVANERPFPDGTIIVKEATRSDANYPWLVATARKLDGEWQWDEYTRNFEDEDFVHIISGESVCIDCHDSAKDRDWIFTRYTIED